MNSDKVIRKRNIYLAIFLGIITVFVGLFVLIGLNITDPNQLTLYYLVLFTVLLLISLYFKKLLTSYNNLVKLAKVIKTQAQPLNYKDSVVENVKYFYNQGYQSFISTQDFTLLYKHVVDKSLKVKKIKKLYVVVLIKNKGYDFYHKNIHDEINKLEDSFKRKDFPSKYIITAYKEVDHMTDGYIKEIGEVVSYSVYKQTYVQINVGLAKDEKKAYFLYSNSYYPNSYYKEAVDSIKNSIK